MDFLLNSRFKFSFREVMLSPKHDEELPKINTI